MAVRDPQHEVGRGGGGVEPQPRDDPAGAAVVSRTVSITEAGPSVPSPRMSNRTISPSIVPAYSRPSGPIVKPVKRRSVALGSGTLSKATSDAVVDGTLPVLKVIEYG